MWLSGAAAAAAGLAGSTSAGGANTVAVADIVAGWLLKFAMAAPTGSRGAAGFWLRRTGANARAALHPCDSVCFNKRCLEFYNGSSGEIPAVAFPEAPPGPASVGFASWAGATTGCSVDTGVTTGTGGGAVAMVLDVGVEREFVVSGRDEEKVEPDENCMPP